MQKPKTFGQTLRTLRESQKMPLRELSASLGIHQSTLSKTERGERKPHSRLIEQTSKFFNIKKEELLITFLSDKIAGELKEMTFASDILKETEKKLKYLKNKKR